MRIGIFDSGLGGLFLMKPIVAALPQYDYVYLGDTKNLPYGDKSQDEIYRFTKRAVGYLLTHGCAIVLVMCNTASAMALRRIQQKGYRALGIIIPTLILGCTHYVVLKDLIRKLAPGVRVISQDELIADKVRDYLARHSEIESKLSRSGKQTFVVTKLTPEFQAQAEKWFDRTLQLVVY